MVIHWPLMMNTTRLGLLLLLIAGVSHGSQETVDYLADNLGVQYTVITNFRENEGGAARTDVEITLTNSGDEDVIENDWEIYLCSVRMLEPDVLYDDPDGVADLGGGVLARHVQGCLHKFSFSEAFDGLDAGEVLVVALQTSDWTVARTDISPNWYVAAPSATARTLLSTAGQSLDFVTDFTSEEQWKRRVFDEYNPYTAQDRYALFEDVSDNEAPGRRLMPTPVEYGVTSSQTMNIRTGDWLIVTTEPSTDKAAQYLADNLNSEVVDGVNQPTTRYVRLMIGEISDINGDEVLVAEAYKLSIFINGLSIQIVGKDTTGLMHGVQSLLSLDNKVGEVPDVVVVDYPRFHYRGVHADVGRNFLPKDDVITLLEVMSMYKLNKFHFHLSDDEGWRLEIPGLEELTEVGGKRCHDLEELTCVISQLGSGPGSNNLGSGFYTVEEYQEILQYAEDRSIEVIPEFDMPGHCHAPIKAMEARYEALKDTDMAAATEFLLSDPDDESLYVSIQYFRDNAINPCINSSYAFVNKVIQEVQAMHQGIQPLEIFHFGGDEVPHGSWIGSPACEAYIGRPLVPEDSTNLMIEFVVRTGEMVHSAGLDFGGWEDGLMKSISEPFERTDFNSDKVYGMTWNNIWEWGGGSRAYVLANAEYNVVLSHATDLYFDMPYEPDPEERGFYWATRFTETRNTFNYMPDRVYDNMEVDLFGRPLIQDDVCESVGCVPLEPGKEPFIEGIQGHLWSETVRLPEQFYYMVLPRLLAVAERGWHKGEWEDQTDETERKRLRDEDWSLFANTLGYKELARLDDLGVTYNVPVPGAKFDGGDLLAGSHYPGLTVQYSTDGGTAWSDYVPGVSVPADTAVLLRTRSADNSRVSRTTEIQSPAAPEVREAAQPFDPIELLDMNSSTRFHLSWAVLLTCLMIVLQ